MEKANCFRCPFDYYERICRIENGKSPAGCPTVSKGKTLKKACKEYQKPEIAKFAKQASIQEGEGYRQDPASGCPQPVKCRLQEIIEFSQKMKFQHLGLAFCAGLRDEAGKVGNFFIKKGFEVTSVICKAGGTPKEKIGVKNQEKVQPGNYETMCNPVFQAMVMNEAKTDFNITLGLCVGHDSLLFKYSDAPCTVLAVKDRVLGHNPLAAVYNIDSYYKFLGQEGM